MWRLVMTMHWPLTVCSYILLMNYCLDFIDAMIDFSDRLFKNQMEVEFHAAKSGHSNFSESTEEKKPLTEEEKKEQLARLEEKLRLKVNRKIISAQSEAIVFWIAHITKNFLWNESLFIFFFVQTLICLFLFHCRIYQWLDPAIGKRRKREAWSARKRKDSNQKWKGYVGSTAQNWRTGNEEIGGAKKARKARRSYGTVIKISRWLRYSISNSILRFIFAFSENESRHKLKLIKLHGVNKWRGAY